MIALFLLISFFPFFGLPPDAELPAAIEKYQFGEYEKAAESLSRQVRSDSDNALLRIWLGKSYLRLSRWDEAIREFERAVQIEPNYGPHHLWLGRALGRKAEHSLFFAALAPARRVLKEFEAAVRLAPDSPEARFDLLEFYLDAPGVLGGGKDKAMIQAKEIARINKRMGYTARSRVYQKDQKWDAALKELTQATVEFASDPGAFLDLAEYLFQRKVNERAADMARTALGLGAGAGARLILAAVLVRLRRDVATAEADLRALAAGPLQEDDPAFEEIHYWLGQAMLALGKNAGARQQFQKALTFDPNYSPAKTALHLTRREP